MILFLIFSALFYFYWESINEILLEWQEKVIVFFYKRIEYSAPYQLGSRAYKVMLKNKYLTAFLFIVLLWAIHLLVSLGVIEVFGLRPRSLKGFLGIFTYTFFHGSFGHLIGNSLGLILFLPVFIFVRRQNILFLLFMMILIKGALLWFFARGGQTIGASGLVYAIWGYLIFNGLLSKDLSKIFLSCALIIPSASMFKGMNPLYVGTRVSFEGHFFGMVAGMLVAWICFDRIKHDWIDLAPEVPLTQD